MFELFLLSLETKNARGRKFFSNFLELRFLATSLLCSLEMFPQNWHFATAIIRGNNLYFNTFGVKCDEFAYFGCTKDTFYVSWIKRKASERLQYSENMSNILLRYTLFTRWLISFSFSLFYYFNCNNKKFDFTLLSLHFDYTMFS